tara:strand:+ start:480 stop:860 length:381 start_codon:yes stop_codon:yes gene_type:complete
LKYYNELEQSWRKLKADKPEEAKSIEYSDRVCYLSDDGNWLRKGASSWERGWIYRAPVKEKQPLSFEDIKQGDAVRSIGSKLWFYVEPGSDWVTLVNSINDIKYIDLMGKYEIRSIGETNWRPCHK